MVITFKVPDAAALPLAGGGREGSSELEVAHEDAVQISPLLRAAAPALAHRGNRLVRVAWSTTRQHADQEQADAFALEHVQRLPRSAGTLTLGSRLALSPATVRLASCRVVGLTTIARYEAQGALS